MMLAENRLMQGMCAAALSVAILGAASAQQTIGPASNTPVPAPVPDILQNYTPVRTEPLRNPEDGNLLLFRRTYDGWGYSPLSQITAANVANLQLV
jgi:alcohol dehydrogenase (cytochrome c)